VLIADLAGPLTVSGVSNARMLARTASVAGHRCATPDVGTGQCPARRCPEPWQVTLLKVQGPVIADSARNTASPTRTSAIPGGTRSEPKYYDDGFTMAVGPGQSADLLEVGTVDADDGLVIIHAMRARPSTLDEVLGAQGR